MHVEVRVVNDRKKYYLAASYRLGPKVAKVRVFLGTDLTKDEIESRSQEARKELENRVRAAKSIGDPYRTILSRGEMGEIELLTA